MTVTCRQVSIGATGRGAARAGEEEGGGGEPDHEVEVRVGGRRQGPLSVRPVQACS